MAPSTKDNSLKGFIYGVIASVAYGMNPVFAVPLYEEGMDPVSVLFFRYLLGIPAIWLLMLYRGRKVNIGFDLISRVGLLGIIMVVSSLTLFFSYTQVDIGVASTILFVYPLIVALIMVCFYHEIMSTLSYLCMFGALGGVFLLCDSSIGATISVYGVIMVLVSALAYAVYIALANHSPYKNIATLSLTFWVLVFGFIVLSAVVAVRGTLAYPHSLLMWFNAVMIAIVPTVISFLFTNKAIETIGATPTATLGVFEPLTAVIFGVMFFGEVLSVRNIIGMMLILVCTTLVITRRDITRRILAIRTLFPKVRRHNSHRSTHRSHDSAR